EPREDPVARWRVIEQEHVAGLLAAEVGADPLHLLVDIAVADLGLDDPDAGGGQRLIEPEVCHHRGDDDATLEAAGAGEVTGADRESEVPVADRARRVDRDQPIAVAVEREADVGARGSYPGDESFRVHGAAAAVDVRAV